MAAVDPILIRLHHALQGDDLPPEGRSLGQRLMARLNQPTRIALIGFPGSGKTTLANMVLGAPLMPGVSGLCSVELGFAEKAGAEFVLADGTLRTADGHWDPARIPRDAVRATQWLPDPRLREWSFLEVTLSPGGPDPAELLAWMSQRSDIAIWCSQQFDDRERQMWSQVPDHLKDHSFLVLTRADQLFMKGDLTDRIARLQPVVADEFLGLYPVASLQAQAARKADAAPNEALWQSSGARAFVEAIANQVDQSRTASLDHAYVLLERYKAGLTGAEPAPAAPALPPPAARAAPPDPVDPPPSRPASSRPAPAPQRADTATVIRRALGLLQGCAEDILATPDAAKAAGAERILDRCSATAETLVELLSEAKAADPDLEALKNDAIEGEQMLMLMRLERGETAAEDSLTVLLQLKKEMSERLAK